MQVQISKIDQGSRSTEFGAEIQFHSQCQKYVCFFPISDEKFPIWPRLLCPKKLQMYQLKIIIKTVRKYIKMCWLLSFYNLTSDFLSEQAFARAGGPDPPPKNHKNIGFLSNTGPNPLENHNAAKPAFNVGLS